MHNNTFIIHTHGCKVNQYDSNLLYKKLEQSGMAPVENGGADWIIINTCAVTKTAISKNKRTLSRVRRENPGARIILIGCWPEAYRGDLNNIQTEAILGVGETGKIFSLMGIRPPSPDLAAPQAGRSRYFIKIQDGCEQFCSYCIIPYTRGKPKSRPAGEVLIEVKNALEAGYREIVLSGIHLGLYGHGQDIELTDLLEKLLNIRGPWRIRLSSIELNEITEGLIGLIARERSPEMPYICRHLHIPLQSGSDKILRLMRRPYDTLRFTDKITRIRQVLPDIAVTTDVISGFPGESELDFRASFDYIEKTAFSRLHVFPFSPHEKTPAARLPGQISRKTVLGRAKKLRMLGLILANKYRDKFQSAGLDTIPETQHGRPVGKTEFYFNVNR